MNCAWLSSEHEWIFRSIKNQFQSYPTAAYTRQLAVGNEMDFSVGSRFVIVSDVMSVFVCVHFKCTIWFLLWKYLVLLSPEINCHLNWHAFVENVSNCVWWALSGWHAKTWLSYKQYQSFSYGFAQLHSSTTITKNEFSTRYSAIVNTQNTFAGCALSLRWALFMQKKFLTCNWIDYNGSWW